ncbi:hypothetical protein I302_103859 [Kwoniella bestiolae CBS 10118]|uniref:Uncharacterized protein n=1 Tax=Kwoniella bestiolae CBS 10118 TaxID=1296100 RepID=A0A1B9G9N1_9TREE|nr:hypothetical protein I302_02562 [Kwoniella bestiolae CBS 10118]OCF27717.1 hypothetical protein I302_02562 [Kwoniella bestiolae CBS 10118]
MGDRTTSDPTRGESQYSLKSAKDFQSEVIAPILQPREVQQSPETERADRDIEITHFEPGSNVALALQKLTERASRDMQKMDGRVCTGYENYPSKGDFLLKFVSREEYINAFPPLCKDVIDSVPLAVDEDQHYRYLQSKWGDATIGEWSKISQPEDGRMFIPVIRSKAESSHESSPVSMEALHDTFSRLAIDEGES